ncbi:uncharacterized protein K02A2.6-like [Photinus pyralis]|uniref:uncharacterized protein K02A2.6-like n=1 Tax=Photinus pyralis TaxID=7054 RepID=UPI0012676F22|nr:uncharacterized protein K02A2.6-like [Photinus pyralis]XP_031350597.1 uncharacterized protein K02A2.6-like [Photinus pyralis]
MVKTCLDCLLMSKPSRPPPMTRHKFPNGPWQHIAIDLMKAGPIPEEILVVIDYFSRYQEIKFLKSSTAATIIAHLQEMFSRLGIPNSIRADNGPQFASKEFHLFCEGSNIEIIHTTPYWPQANGEVENLNRSILKRLKISHVKKIGDTVFQQPAAVSPTSNPETSNKSKRLQDLEDGSTNTEDSTSLEPSETHIEFHAIQFITNGDRTLQATIRQLL